MMKVMRAAFRSNLAAPGASLVAMALFLSCDVSSGQEAPDGWTVFSSQTPGLGVLLCANRSREWKVSLDAEKVVISEHRYGGGISMIEYGKGKLEGLDRGEFGGGLWWLEGGSKTKLSNDIVRGFVRTQFGTLAFVGLHPMGPVGSGKVLIIGGGDTGPPTTTLLADLGGYPQAFALAPEGSVVLVTSTKIYRIKSPGAIETIRSAEYEILYPNSVAVLRSGAIYVGMRYFVTRLTPKGSSYKEDWLLPSDCPGYRCVCDELPKALLIARLTVAEAEARLKPFSEFTTKEWERLRRQMQPGDELWTWGNVLGAGGIALVRNGDPVASIDAWRNLNERR
jgi:hypothetical protein